jgi:hypothetical protein
VIGLTRILERLLGTRRRSWNSTWLFRGAITVISHLPALIHTIGRNYMIRRVVLPPDHLTAPVSTASVLYGECQVQMPRSYSNARRSRNPSTQIPDRTLSDYHRRVFSYLMSHWSNLRSKPKASWPEPQALAGGGVKIVP